MRRSPSVPTFGAALAALLLPAALAAQTAQTAASTPAAAARPAGCRGTRGQTSTWTLARENGPPVVFPGYPSVDWVQPGSPADAGGMKPGDLIVVQDGHDLIANPPKQPSLAGDTVVFVVRRNGAEVPLTVVLGRWDPPDEAPGVSRVCRAAGTGPGRG